MADSVNHHYFITDAACVVILVAFFVSMTHPFCPIARVFFRSMLTPPLLNQRFHPDPIQHVHGFILEQRGMCYVNILAAFIAVSYSWNAFSSYKVKQSKWKKSCLHENPLQPWMKTALSSVSHKRAESKPSSVQPSDEISKEQSIVRTCYVIISLLTGVPYWY